METTEQACYKICHRSQPPAGFGLSAAARNRGRLARLSSAVAALARMRVEAARVQRLPLALASLVRDERETVVCLGQG
jgi:hypothetical protein